MDPHKTQKGDNNVDQLSKADAHARAPLAHVAGVILHTEFKGASNDPEAVPLPLKLEIWM